RGIDPLEGEEERGAAVAVVEPAPDAAVAAEAEHLFRHGDRAAHLDAQGLGLAGGGDAEIDRGRRRQALAVGLAPVVTRLEHRRDRSALAVYLGGLGFPDVRQKTASGLQLQPSIRLDLGDAE